MTNEERKVTVIVIHDTDSEPSDHEEEKNVLLDGHGDQVWNLNVVPRVRRFGRGRRTVDSVPIFNRRRIQPENVWVRLQREREERRDRFRRLLDYRRMQAARRVEQRREQARRRAMQRRDAARLAAGPNRMVIGDRVISPEYTSESSDATSEVSYDTDDFSISEEYDIARRFRTPLPSDDEAGF